MFAHPRKSTGLRTTSLRLEPLEARELLSAPIATPDIWQNPHLTTNNFSGIHFNAYETDTTSAIGPGTTSSKIIEQAPLSPIPLGIAATLTFDSQGRIITVWGGATLTTSGLESGRRLQLIDPESLEILTEVELPPAVSGGGTSFGAGGYFYLDNQDRAVVPTSTQQIRIYDLVNDQFVEVERFDFSAAIGDASDILTSAIPDASGNIWIITQKGDVGYVDPVTGNMEIINLEDINGMEEGTAISNSMASDEDGGVYINSNHALYRFEVGATGSPEVIWRTEYDRGDRQKPGQVDQGSGTTPTLFNDFEGNKFVAITDNADPRMHVNVYNRETGELVAQQEVFQPFLGANENSLIAVNNSIIVENNYGFSVEDTFGPLTLVGGIARVDFDPTTGESEVVWENPSAVPSVVSQLSTEDGLIYTYVKKESGWFFTAIDFESGATVSEAFVPSSEIAGGIPANNWYSGIGIGPDGSAYTGVFGGLVAWRPAGPLGVATEFAVGSGQEGSPDVRVYSDNSGTPRLNLTPYTSDFTEGIRVAAADITVDGVAEVITATGPGTTVFVRAFDGTTGEPLEGMLSGFFPFEGSFTGGAYVSAGDLTGDGKAEIVVSPGNGGGPRVKIYAGDGSGVIADFMGIQDATFRGGVNTSLADVNNDGVLDLIVGAGEGGGPRVAVFDGTTLTSGNPVKLFGDLFVFESSQRGGVNVSGGDVNGDEFADLIIGAGAGGGPRVLILSGAELVQSGTQQQLADFFVGDLNNRGGIRVAAKDLDGDEFADLVTGVGSAVTPQVASYLDEELLGGDPQPSTEFDAFSSSFADGVFVG